MAHCVSHLPCPKCGSKDNLGDYDDGSQWCFGCHYYVPPSGMKRYQRALRREETTEKWGNIQMPSDATYRIDELHLTWLRKYSITFSEIIQFGIMSSKSHGLLLPIFNKNSEVLFFVNRPFKDGYAKSLDNGKKPFVVFPHRKEQRHVSTVVVVEDYVSAIRVSRYFNCLPLFGSNLSTAILLRLKKQFDHVIVWLDPDKTREAIKQALRYSTVVQTSVIRSEADPKETADEQIINLVEGKCNHV